MLHVYDPFVIRRMAEGRIFFINPQMPYEFLLQCFYEEQPFFLISQLEDARIAVTPNMMFFPPNFLQAGWGPLDLLPNEFEYVTLKDNAFPVIITAHPVNRIDEWLKKFERFVKPFAKQTLWDFITACHEFQPLFEHKTEYPVREPITK